MCGQSVRCGLIAVIAALALPVAASAQIFGERTLGRGVSRRPAPGRMAVQSQETVGRITGGERYLRANRDLLDFVGRGAADTGETFVGLLQAAASGRVRTAVEDLVRRRPPSANLRAARTNQSGSAMYEPRLEIGFAFQPPTPGELQRDLSARLNESLGPVSDLGPLRVSLQQRTAILRGEVASEEARLLAEALVALEPGVSQVENLIRVVGARR